MKSRAHINWSEVKKKSAERRFLRLQKKQARNQKRTRKVWEYRTMKGGVRVKWRVVGQKPRVGHLAIKRKIIQ